MTIERRAQIARVLSDPPIVHDGVAAGVWKTSTSCYEFLADRIPVGGRTLETGLGVSTVLLGLWAAQHTCVVGSQEQVDRLASYVNERNLAVEGLRFEVGYSDDVLPRMKLPPIDAFLIDGGHGYPTPVIDWYFGARFLRPGGVVVIDDIQLPHVDMYLVRFLDKDPRWRQVARDEKWVAFEKTGDHGLREDWGQQEFVGRPRVSLANRVKIKSYRQLQRFRRG